MDDGEFTERDVSSEVKMVLFSSAKKEEGSLAPFRPTSAKQASKQLTGLVGWRARVAFSLVRNIRIGNEEHENAIAECGRPKDRPTDRREFKFDREELMRGGKGGREFSSVHIRLGEGNGKVQKREASKGGKRSVEKDIPCIQIGRATLGMFVFDMRIHCVTQCRDGRTDHNWCN